MAAAAKFMLVLFVDDIGKTRSIDIVPAKWVSYDEDKDHLVTPFITDCSKANLRILKDLVQSEGEPLQSWDLHRVSVRGSAASYSEAEEKIINLATQSFAFTTDTEEHAKEKEREITKKYKRLGNKYKTQDVDELFATSAFDFRNQNTKLPATNTISESGKRNKQANADGTGQKKKVLSSKGSRGAKLGRQRDLAPRKSPPVPSSKRTSEFDSSADESSSDSDPARLTHARNGGNGGNGVSTPAGVESRGYASSKSKLTEMFGSDSDTRDTDIIGSAQGPSPSRDPKLRNESIAQRQPSKVPGGKIRAENSNRPTDIVDSNVSTGILDVQGSDDLKSTVLKCYHRLSAQIGQLQTQLADVKIRQTEIISVATELGPNRIQHITGIDSTIEKYGLRVPPFKTLEEFVEFDTKLKSNKSIRTEITHGITALVNADGRHLSRSTREILQRFMTRDLLLQFTVVRQSGNKVIFKTGTTLYICIRDAILSKCENVTEKHIRDAIGSVINNAKDWDGHRQTRKKVGNDGRVEEGATEP